jgi:integrase
MADDEKPGKRRAGHGEDSIYWDESKQRFIGAISHGFTPAGKRRRPKVRGKTKTEVRQKLRKLRKELEAGVRTPANYKVEDAVNDWFARGLSGRDEKTVTLYRGFADNHLIPALGNAKLNELDADEVDDWLLDRAEHLSTRTLRILHSILRRSITQAQRRDKVLRNVALLVTTPEGRPGRPSKSLTLDQAKTVLTTDQGSRTHAYVVLSLLVGVRTEEARPLRWQHVHLTPPKGTKPHVEVWRSVRRHGDTKTRLSRRTLALPKLVVDVLAAHRERQRAEWQTIGRSWNEKELVFSTRTGTPLAAGNVRRDFRILLRKASLPADEWTPRELRHSFVSLLSDHGISAEDIAKVVGHRSTNTTEIVYRKQLRPVITGGADAMDQIFAADKPDGQREGKGKSGARKGNRGGKKKRR